MVNRGPPRIHLLQDFAADFTRPSVLKFAKRQACDPSDGRQILRCSTQRLFGNFPRSTATWPAGENQRLKRTPRHSKWPFYPLLGGHQQPLKGTCFHHLTINLPPTVYIIPYSLIVLFYVYIEIRITVSTFELFSHSAKGPWNKSLNFMLPLE